MRQHDSASGWCSKLRRTSRSAAIVAALVAGALVAVPGASASQYVLEDWDGPSPVGNWKTNPVLDFNGWESFVSDGSMSTSRAPSGWEGRGLYGRAALSLFAGDGVAEWRWKTPGTSTIFKAEYAPAAFNLLGCLNEGMRKADGSWQATGNGAPGAPQRPSSHPTACGVGVQLPPLLRAQVILGPPGRQVFCSNTSQPCSRLASPIGNSAVFGIQRLALAQLPFSAYLPGGRLYLTDYDRPTLTRATNSLPNWVKAGNGQITVTATDTGLGVKAIRWTSPGRNGSPVQQTQAHLCSGDRNDRCPATWNAARPSYTTTFSYNVDDLPEGVNHFGVKATDIVENESVPAGADNRDIVPPTKVDRSAPTGVTATGGLADLRDQYTNGQGTKTVTVSAHDPAAADGQALSGVKQLAIEDIGHGTVASANVQCATDQCPADATATLIVDLSRLAEGKHQLRAVATDLAGNTRAGDSWTVFVDRTGPIMTGTVDTVLDEGDGIADLTWDPAADPALATGEAGAGFTRYEVRARSQGGAWPAYQTVSASAFSTVELGSHQVGDQVEYEIKAYDAVGNVSAFAGTSTVTPTDVTASEDGEFAPGEATQPTGGPDPGEDAQWRNVDPTEEMDTAAPATDPAGSAASPGSEQTKSLGALAAAAESYDTRICARDGYGSPCGEYSGRTAAAYARKFALSDHGSKRNFDYTYFDNDCTNFVSQALHFGGMRFMRTYPGINDPRHDDNDLYVKGSGSWWSQKYTNFLGRTRYRNSTSWSVAWVLYNQLFDHGLARTVSPSERLRSGDIIFYWWNGRNRIEDINHVNVVAGVRKRRVYIAQHTTDRFVTIRKFNDLAREGHPNVDRVVLRPVATRFDLP